MFSRYKVKHNMPVPRLSQRIAEEAQLLAEEKWIIETLQKIKTQRNSLQIERLHLESLRAKVIAKMTKEQVNQDGAPVETPSCSKTNTETVETPVEMLQQKNLFQCDNSKPNFSNLDDNEICNTEELNLSVTNSVFHTVPYEAQCDEEEDDEDIENCLLDMDLLMSGK